MICWVDWVDIPVVLYQIYLSEHSLLLSETLLFGILLSFFFLSFFGAGFRESGLMVLYTRAKNEMDENIALPEEWMEEIVDELKKVVILKGVVVYCGADATLLQEICTPMFAAKSETTKKSKKNGYDGKTYRLVTYPHPKSEDQTTESRHFGDSEAAMERLVMTIPNHVQGVAPHSQAVDQVMVAAVNSKRMVTFMIGKETTEPPAFRALAHSFDRYVVFGCVRFFLSFLM